MTMRKMMLLAIVLMATLSGNAQIEEGDWALIVKAGVGKADLTGKLYDSEKAEGTYDATLHPITSVVVGAEAEYGMTDQLSLVLGANFCTQGAKTNDDLFKVSMSYFNVPLLVQCYPIRNFGLAIKAGAQVGFVSRKILKIDGVTYSADYVKVYSKYWNRPVYVESELSKQFNKVDFSIPVGISYELFNFVLDVRYNIGLTNVMKDDPENSRNRVWQFTLGYKFNLGD